MSEWKPEIRKRLASLSLDPAREVGIVEELAKHLEDRYQELLARGASIEEAHLSVLKELSDGQLLVGELRRLERQLGNETLVLGARRMNMLGNLIRMKGSAIVADVRRTSVCRSICNGSLASDRQTEVRRTSPIGHQKYE